MGSPVNLATNETWESLRGLLRRKKSRILEVGCGQGHLARRMKSHGHQVIAIDNSREAVRVARTKGVTSIHVDFKDHRDDPYDSVLFTRSLHHIHPLRRAVLHAYELLNPGGRLLVQDFAVERMNSRTARWFFDSQELLVAAGILPSKSNWDWSLVPLKRWQKAHQHSPPLHMSRTMLSEIRRRFSHVSVAKVPYLFRYFCSSLPNNERGYQVARQVLAMEKRGITEGTIVSMGLWITGLKRF